MFQCPSCKTGLTPIRVLGRGSLRCLRCGSVALAGTSFEWMVKKSFREAILTLTEHQAGTPKIACPACSQLMLEIPLHASASKLAILQPSRAANPAIPPMKEPFPISVCRRCHLVWFQERRLRDLPLRSREALRAELSTIENYDREINSHEPPGDLLHSVLASQFGLPFKENVPELKSQPVCTWLLIATLAIAWRLLATDPRLASVLTLQGSNPLRLGGLDTLSYVIVHPRWFPLAVNLYFVWLFGANIEQLIGRFWFLALALASILGGAFLHSVIMPGPLAGGAPLVAGLMTFFALSFPHARIGLEISFFGGPGDWFRFNSWLWIGFWLASIGVSELIGLEKDAPMMIYGVLGGAAAGMLMQLAGAWGPADSDED